MELYSLPAVGVAANHIRLNLLLGILIRFCNIYRYFFGRGPTCKNRQWLPENRLLWFESISSTGSPKSHLMHGWSRSTNPSRTDFDSWKASNKKGYSIVPRKKKIPRNDLGIPEYEMESLARMLLPILKKYIDSEEGKLDWQEWQARMNNGAEGTISTETTEELNLSVKTKGYPKSQSHRRETVCGFARM